MAAFTGAADPPVLGRMYPVPGSPLTTTFKVTPENGLVNGLLRIATVVGIFVKADAARPAGFCAPASVPTRREDSMDDSKSVALLPKNGERIPAPIAARLESIGVIRDISGAPDMVDINRFCHP